jgi:hypothetical protein
MNGYTNVKYNTIKEQEETVALNSIKSRKKKKDYISK